jgi:AraC-like DNA-binding protein
MAARETDAVLLIICFRGEQIFESPQNTVVLRPGDVLLQSSRATGRLVIPEAIKKRTIKIPMAALAPFGTGTRVPDCLVLSGRKSPLASLAHDYVVGVPSQVERMSPAEVEGARSALLAFTAGMIRASQPADVSESDFLPLLRQQLEAWIVDHLTLGAIRVRDLAAAHNVAPRTVHRAFATTGDTLGSVIRAHRIAAARSDVVNTTSSIAAIAHRWGFCDASHLGREFRRIFSMSPNEYREAYFTVRRGGPTRRSDTGIGRDRSERCTPKQVTLGPLVE